MTLGGVCVTGWRVCLMTLGGRLSDDTGWRVFFMTLGGVCVTGWRACLMTLGGGCV